MQRWDSLHHIFYFELLVLNMRVAFTRVTTAPSCKMQKCNAEITPHGFTEVIVLMVNVKAQVITPLPPFGK